MKIVKLVPITLALLTICSAAQGQNFMKRLGDAAKNAAENAAIRKTEQKTDEAVSGGIDKATDKNTYKGSGKSDNSENSNREENAPASNSSAASSTKAAAPEKTIEMTYAKSDFVPGDEIIFDDPMDAEQLGEFPSMWDLYAVNAEVASVGGKKAILIAEHHASVGPLMKALKNYLGDVFTVEFDYLVVDPADTWFALTFYTPDGDNLMQFNRFLSKDRDEQDWFWESNNGRQNGSGHVAFTEKEWHHVAVSFNKRAWKVYIDGVRYVNVPNVKTPPGWFDITLANGNTQLYITNMRIAKGAVPLYDRMMSEGKFITYGITFDVGKSTIKPESMGEINRIAQLMKDNPDLKFSVEGHTDNTGSAATNQKLSDERSAAVVAKLVEQGIAKERLKSSGKGQSSPVADNSTDEGRAKNRRVEFVKQ